jgi:hypothetical protein
MSDRVPSLFLLVPGHWRDADDLVASLRERGISATLAAQSPMGRDEVRVELVETASADAFSWGRRGKLDEELLRRVSDCPSTALVECGFRLDEAPLEVALIGRALRDAGGEAVRMEASGAASAWAPWLAHLESRLPARIYSCAVLLVADDDNVTFTCGMHQFDLPDAQIRTANPSEGMAWLDEFCVYQLAEQPALLLGHTFQPSAEFPRRSLERWPDDRHHPNDGRYNPFGLWRFLEPGVRGIRGGSTVPIIMPALVATLLSHERAAGRPLTRPEVQEIVGKCPAVVMKASDVRAFERARGYADIEPELAWEQWRIVRTTM